MCLDFTHYIYSYVGVIKFGKFLLTNQCIYFYFCYSSMQSFIYFSSFCTQLVKIGICLGAEMPNYWTIFLLLFWREILGCAKLKSYLDGSQHVRKTKFFRHNGSNSEQCLAGIAFIICHFVKENEFFSDLSQVITPLN